MNFIQKIALNLRAFRRVLGKEKDLLLETKEKAKNENAILFKGAELINATLNSYSYVAQNSIISNSKVGKFCSIGPNVVCGYGDHPLNYLSTSPVFYHPDKMFDKHFYSKNDFYGYEPVVIEHDVWIGANVYIKNGVKIGTGAVVGAGSVVLKDVTPYAVVGGVPAKIIRYRFDEDIIKSLLKIEWWNWQDHQLEEAKKYFVTNRIEEFIKVYGRA